MSYSCLACKADLGQDKQFDKQNKILQHNIIALSPVLKQTESKHRGVGSLWNGLCVCIYNTDFNLETF